MTDLDRAESFSSIDSHDFLSRITGFPAQLRDALKLAESFSNQIPEQLLSPPISSIVLAGVGGSAIGAEFIRCRFAYESKVPIALVRHYRLPLFVDESTLLIACSYSGNTEETISAVQEALQRSAKMVIISSGGKLEEIARRSKIPFLTLPKNHPPRMAMGFSIVAILSVLQVFKIGRSFSGEINEAAALLERKANGEYSALIPESKNRAKQIARLFFEKIPVIYSSCDLMEAVCLRWREQIEENAKALASHFLFPEMTHNEIVGWSQPKQLMGRFVAVFLEDTEDHSRVVVRFNYSEKVIQNAGASTIRLTAEGESPFARMFSLSYLSDFVSFYLAMLYEVDPTSIDVIDRLKQELVQ